jgi:hypothetical protein
MSRYLSALFLFIACAVGAADLERVTLTITVTNPPVTGYSLTVNSSERIWTNATTSTTITTNSTVNNSATNLFLHIAASSFGTPRLILQWANTNEIRLIGQPGQVISATTNGLWATLTLSTQSGPTTLNAIYPFANIIGTTNRTNQASHFVRGMSDYATNSFATNATALLGYVTRGTPVGGSQTVTGRTAFYNLLTSTNLETIYAGKYSAPTNINPINTNLINYGNAIRSEGLGGKSLQLGSNAMANGSRGISIGADAFGTNDDAVAIGTGAIATNTSTLAIGNAARASAVSATAIGNDALALHTGATAVGDGAAATNDQALAYGPGARGYGAYSISIGSESLAETNDNIAIGTTATATVYRGIAIGTSASSAHENSIAIGTSATTTTTNEIRMGTSVHLVTVPGALSGTTTNATLRGTNILNGGLILTGRINGNAANGNNTGLLLGTNWHVTIMGPSAAYTNGGFVAEPEGTEHSIQLTNPVATCLIVNDALDGTAANRILTGTGADLLLTNNPAFLHIRYDGAASRWRVKFHSR